MYKFLPILLFAYGLAITTEDIYDNSYALIIGIDKYKNVQNLNYAVKDAESIQDILVNTFDFSEGNVTLLKNEDATKQNIIQAFSDITTKAEESDRVLIYFAGHGETMDLPDGGEMGYLLPVDGNNENLYVSSIGMGELKNISLMSKAKHLLYLVDACYGGIATIGSRGLDSKTTPNYIEKITKNKSRQIITAGGRGEQVIEKSEWGHSAFTLHLNRGLKDGNADMNADGYITAAELGIYLSEKVTIDSENQQTPQYGRMTSQEGEFVFIYKVENVTIQSEKTVISDSSTVVDYNTLADIIAEKLREEKTVVKSEHADKRGGVNISLGTKTQKGITVYGSISLAKLDGGTIPATGESSEDDNTDGDMDINLNIPFNMELDNVLVPAFGIEKRFGPVVAGFGYYSSGYSMDINILFITMKAITKINYLNVYSVYPYSMNERIAVGAGFGLGIPISGKATAEAMGVTQNTDVKIEDMKMDLSLLINASYAISERYGVRLYYQHGLTEMGEIMPSEADSEGFDGRTNRIAGAGLFYRF